MTADKEFAPDQLPEELEQKFMDKVRNADSLEEARWLTTIASSLEDWEWKDAKFQASVISNEYGHKDLLWAVDKHYSKWLEEEDEE